jgi:ABC-type glycerol-3-phosphate transport system substrate-binding protein
VKRRISGVVIIFLAFVMVIGSLAGCTSKSAVDKKGEATSSAEAAKGVETPLVAETAKPQEKIKIRMMGRDVRVPVKDDKVVEFLSKKFNMTFENIFVPSPNQTEVFEKMNMMIASKDIPDILESRNDMPIAKEIYDNLVKADKILNIGKFVAEHSGRYPNIEARINDPDAKSYAAADGQIYQIPRLFGAWDHGLYIRQDWLDKLSLKAPTTHEELYNVLKEFVAKDPDGKKNVGLTISNTWWLNHFYAGWTGAFDWAVRDGKFVNVWSLPEQKEALKFVHKLYAEKLLDNEFFTHKQERDEIAKFTTGRAGALMIGVTLSDRIVPEMTKFNPNSKVSYFNFNGPKGPARISGNKYFEAISINKDTKDPERVMDYIEYLMSEEGKNLWINGVEGVHYTKDAEGKIVPNLDIRKHEGWDKGPHSVRALVDISANLPDNFTTNIKDIRAYLEYLKQPNIAAVNPLSGIEFDASKQIGSKPGDVIKKYEAGFITGKYDIDATWDKFVKELYAAGFQKLEDEINSKMKP